MGKKRIIQQEEIAAGSQEGKPVKSKGARQKQFSHSRIFVLASYNNTLVSVGDANGNIISWSSAGTLGFKGPRKATPFAASKVVENIFEKLAGVNLGKVAISVQGVGGGRDAAVRALASRGLDITSLRDATPLPHNGCRPRKARRV